MASKIDPHLSCESLLQSGKEGVMEVNIEILPHKWQSRSLLMWDVECYAGDENLVFLLGQIFTRIYFSIFLVMSTLLSGCH